MMHRLYENLEAVQNRIRQACERSDRDPSKVTLVAVTKTVEPETALALVEAGASDLGESRLAEAQRKQAVVGDRARWHMIGHLQRNKVPKALPLFSLIHSVDSIRLLEAISAAALKREIEADVLLEVNVSGEASKFGFTPEELGSVLERAQGLPGVRARGLMTMAPYHPDPERARPVFRALAALFLKSREEFPDLEILSMGMSGDFEPAVEEGATHVRVGTALFEGI